MKHYYYVVDGIVYFTREAALAAKRAQYAAWDSQEVGLAGTDHPGNRKWFFHFRAIFYLTEFMRIVPSLLATT